MLKLNNNLQTFISFNMELLKKDSHDIWLSRLESFNKHILHLDLMCNEYYHYDMFYKKFYNYSVENIEKLLFIDCFNLFVHYFSSKNKQKLLDLKNKFSNALSFLLSIPGYYLLSKNTIKEMQINIKNHKMIILYFLFLKEMNILKFDLFLNVFNEIKISDNKIQMDKVDIDIIFNRIKNNFKNNLKNNGNIIVAQNELNFVLLQFKPLLKQYDYFNNNF